MKARKTLRLSLGVGLTVLLGTLAAFAQQPAPAKKLLELERLYTYPKLEGTAPVQAAWSKDSKKIAFLWNDKGYPFRDLWVYDLEAKKLTRLTDLDQPRDPWTENPAEKDPKLKKYLPPETGLTGFVWAPDSQKLAFAFRDELYVADVQGQLIRLTRTKEAEATPKFSPESTRLLFTRENNLWVVDLSTGQTTQLTLDGTDDLLYTGAPAWSPDGAWVSFIQRNRKDVPTRLIPNYSGREVTTRRQRRTYAKEENDLLRVGLVPAPTSSGPAAGGTVRWLMEASRDYIRDVQWAPDAKRLAVLRMESNQKNQHIDLIILGETPTTRRLSSESDPAWLCELCNFLAWSPDGQKLLFTSERDAWNHLYLLEVATGATQQLTRGAREVDTGYRAPTDIRPHFSSDGRRIYFTSTAVDPSERHLFVLTLSPTGSPAGEPQRLTERPGYNGAVVSADEQWLALHYSSWAQPGDLYLASTQPGAEPTRLTHAPLLEFENYSWPQPRIVEFPSRDGKKLRALFFQPTTLAVDILRTMAKPGRRPLPKRPAPPQVPGVVFVHGAGYAQAVLNRWGGYGAERFQFNQFLAQRGYAVLDIDYRGSSGYGRDWRTDVYLHLGGKDLEDQLAGVDYLKTLGYVDTDRLGIWGVSYGGFMTLMALFQAPDAFKAGAAWAAVTDWENYHRHYTQERLRTPEEQPEAYRRSSPLHHVAGLKNHLLLIHGMADDNVHFQDAVQLIDALVAAGKDFETMMYPQENHSWSRPATWIHSFRKTFDFFERHLKPGAR